MNPILYYLGRGLQLLGLLITFEAIVFYFGRDATGKLMQMGFSGAFVFLIGWLIIRKR
jgi:high-affinity Fe2+/Pb2+ permease